MIESAGDGSDAFVYGFSSGGSLALYAASRGVGITSLVVVEPPSGLTDTAQFITDVEELVGRGQRAKAVRALFRYQGMPEYLVAQMGPLAEAYAPYAHTIPNDLRIAEALTPDVLSRIHVPTLAVGSVISPPPLHAFVERVDAYIPSSRFLELDGDWHGVPDELLARTIVEFLSPEPLH